MKYSFGNSTLGQSLLTLLNLHFMAPQKRNFSIALKRAGYALFGCSDILAGNYVNLHERAKLVMVDIPYFNRNERSWGLRIPLNNSPYSGIHKIALVVAHKHYSETSEYCFQIKLTSGADWVTVAYSGHRREIMKMLMCYCDPVKGMCDRINTQNDNKSGSL